MTAALAVMLVGLGSYALRASMLVGLSADRVPERVERALAAVAPAVIALIVTTSLRPSATTGLQPDHLVAALVALVITRRTGALVNGALAGMGCIWIAGLTGLD